MVKCPKFGFEITESLRRSYCHNCREGCSVKPRFELGKVDPFKLAQLLKEKREKEERGNDSSCDSQMD